MGNKGCSAAAWKSQLWQSNARSDLWQRLASFADWLHAARSCS
jgi:hypothetical protein